MHKSQLVWVRWILLLGLLLSACAGPVKKVDMPKYNPPAPPQVSFAGLQVSAPGGCRVSAVDLIGAWVTAGTPEKDPFDFKDVNGKACQGVFAQDVLPLFTQANLWYAGAPSCRTCHGPDVNVSYARMNLSDYQSILDGSGRESTSAKGTDILGGGAWDKSTLYTMLTTGQMPPDQPDGTNVQGLLITAGKAK